MTPTEEKDRHKTIEVKPERRADRNPWKEWFQMRIPPPSSRPEFFLLLIVIILCEIVFGLFIGVVLRSIFGWPF